MRRASSRRRAPSVRPLRRPCESSSAGTASRVLRPRRAQARSDGRSPTFETCERDDSADSAHRLLRLDRVPAPRPRPNVVRAVRAALAADEAAVAAPIIVEVLSGIRDGREYSAREAELRALHHVSVDGDASYIAARVGRALADA